MRTSSHYEQVRVKGAGGIRLKESHFQLLIMSPLKRTWGIKMQKKNVIYKGIGVSDGIAVGPLIRYETELLLQKGIKIAGTVIEEQKKQAETAMTDARTELKRMCSEKQKCDEKLSKELLEIQIELTEDPMLVDKIEDLIEQEYYPADDAILEATEQIALLFEQMDDEYYRSRAADIRDIGQRMTGHARGIAGRGAVELSEPAVIYAREITPSEAAHMDKSKLLGFVTERGSPTSHSAILARMLGIPSIVGVIIPLQETADMVVIDGKSGILYVNPSREQITEAKEKQSIQIQEQKRLERFKEISACMRSGEKIEAFINISQSDEADNVFTVGADGVGLFRTEFLFMEADELPNEEKQAAAYCDVLKRLNGYPAIIRTLDVGGDKQIDGLSLPEEENPFLGCRAIRLCLSKPDVFKVQLRAILRASCMGTLKLMFPMISSIEELLAAKELLLECARELEQEGVAYKMPKIGIMVEVPAVAAAIELYIDSVDFISIGTNDLCQYALAADRMNPATTHLCDYFNPAVLRLIYHTIQTADHAQTEVSMCGEMAADPLAVPLLLSMGLRRFSMNANAILEFKDIVSDMDNKICDKLLSDIWKMNNAKEIRNYLENIKNYLENIKNDREKI